MRRDGTSNTLIHPAFQISPAGMRLRVPDHEDTGESHSQSVRQAVFVRNQWAARLVLGENQQCPWHCGCQFL
eukprot:COSAG02_NODE_9_length_59728_cov_36.104714_43_plen_72_part_00